MATEIPEDIVVDILKRLPVKSLMRFQCVSPTWRVLIKSPFFRNMHTKHRKLFNNTSSSRSKKDEYILVSGSPRTEDGYAEFSFYARGNSGELVPMQPPPAFFAFPHSKIELCAPCNGIFCVATKVDGNELYLCNPATRESRRLPERPFGFHSDKFPRSGVSHVVRTAWGFGVVPGTDNLKVVSVMYYGTPGDRYYFYKTNDLYETLVMRYCPFVMKHGIIQFEIFDLSSDTWREVDVVLPDVLGLVKRKKKSRNIRKNRNKDERYVYTMDHWAGGGLFLNGCLHWLYNVCVGEFILSFDMGSETMQAFEVPVHVHSRHPSRYDTLMVLGDCLAMVVQSARVAPISIWVMEEHGVRESWVKRFNLAPYSVPLNILHSWKDDDGDLLLFQAVVSNWTETLVSCNTSGDRYHTYHTRAVNERYLVLQAIVVSDQTMASVRPTTCDHTLVSGESTMMQADTGGFCPLLQKAFAGVSLAGCWRIARWLSLLAVMFVLFFDTSVA